MRDVSTQGWEENDSEWRIGGTTHARRATAHRLTIVGREGERAGFARGWGWCDRDDASAVGDDEQLAERRHHQEHAGRNACGRVDDRELVTPRQVRCIHVALSRL